MVKPRHQQPIHSSSADWNTFTPWDILIESLINVPFQGTVWFKRKACIYGLAKGCLLSCSELLISWVISLYCLLFLAGAAHWSHSASANTLMTRDPTEPSGLPADHIFKLVLAKIASECLIFEKSFDFLETLMIKTRIFLLHQCLPRWTFFFYYSSVVGVTATLLNVTLVLAVLLRLTSSDHVMRDDLK